MRIRNLLPLPLLLLLLIGASFAQDFEAILEAEDMEVKSTSAPVPGGWNLYTDGHIATTIAFSKMKDKDWLILFY